MQRLFSVPKVGLFLDTYSPGVEKRHGEEVKIITLTLRCQPFDAKLATAIDDGLGGDSDVRPNLFKLSTAEPKPHLDRVNLSLGCPRQNLIVFASPDTGTSRIAFLQAKISGTYVRTQKDVSGYAFVFKASFGPVGRDEQEFIHQFFLSQQFVTFEEAEPSMDFDEEEDDEEVQAPGALRVAPMWDDAENDDKEPFNAPPMESVGEMAQQLKAQLEAAPPKPKKRGTRTKSHRHNPEAERTKQVKAGRKNAVKSGRKKTGKRAEARA